MNPILTLYGSDAITLGLASNRQPEVLDGNRWKTASGIPEANRALRDDPQTVRLSASARVLVEDMTKRSLPLDANVKAVVALLKDDETIDLGTRVAYAIIWSRLDG